QVDELVDEDLDAVRVVAEHPRHGRVPVSRAMVVGAEHVDRTLETALELVGKVDDVGRPVGRTPTLLRRQAPDSVVVVAVLRRSGPDRLDLLVRVEPGQEPSEATLELALQGPGVEVDAKAVERVLDLLEHPRNRVARARRELVDVRAAIAGLGRLLPTPPR